MHARSRRCRMEHNARHRVRAVCDLGALIAGEWVGLVGVAGCDHGKSRSSQGCTQSTRQRQGDILLEDVVAQHGAAIRPAVRGVQNHQIAVERRRWRRRRLGRHGDLARRLHLARERSRCRSRQYGEQHGSELAGKDQRVLGTDHGYVWSVSRAPRFMYRRSAIGRRLSAIGDLRSLVQRIDCQAAQQLRIEVRRLLRHDFAGEGNIAQLIERNRLDEERNVGIARFN